MSDYRDIGIGSSQQPSRQPCAEYLPGGVLAVGAQAGALPAQPVA